MTQTGAVLVRASRRRAATDEWALVLASQGIAARVCATGDGFGLEVASEDAERAAAVLESWERENPAAAAAAPQPLPPASGLGVGLAVPLALAAFFLVTGPEDPARGWFARGSGDAGRILAGQWWRVVTSLTLHADGPHVASNALFGALFLTAAIRLLGPGLACALVLAAGAGGNAVNAAVHGPGHVSIGASTAVFGALGVLGGAGAMRLRRRGGRAWLPLAATLGVLAMLGVGERVDFWAHAFGLAAGGGLGFGAARVWPRPPGRGLQRLLGAAALALVVGCWALAWSDGGGPRTPRPASSGEGDVSRTPREWHAPAPR